MSKFLFKSLALVTLGYILGAPIVRAAVIERGSMALGGEWLLIAAGIFIAIRLIGGEEK